VLGIYVMMMALANMFGPWLGGALVQLADWPAVFWFRVPVAALALILSYDLPTAPRSARAAFDVAGASLLALGLALILLALNHLRDWLGVPLGLAGLAAFVGFVRQEMRCARPMLDLAVFRLPGFALLNIASVLTNLGAFSVWLLVPYFLVHTGALSLSESGALLASAAAGTAVASPLGGRLIGKIAAERLALAGAVLVGSGLALIARWEQDTSLVALIAALGVQGVGLGLFQLAYTDIVAARLPRENRGVAGSLAMVTRTLGTVGAATLVLLAFQGLEPSLGFFGAFRRVFALAALVPFAMAGLLVLVSRAR
jgi:MFS family permease